MWYTPFLGGALHLLFRTVRWSIEGEEHLHALENSGHPFIVAFWHGSMTWPWWRMRGGRAAALVSRSKDGSILADLLTTWRYHVVRGSSSRGGADAMELMRSCLAAGRILCITPDGPRGPRHVMKMGALRLAQTEQVPLLPVALGYARKSVLRSWDGFEIPHPGTRARVIVGAPIAIPFNTDREDMEGKRVYVEGVLRALTIRANAELPT